VVVADPGFEQVAENVESFSLAPVAAEKIQKGINAGRTRGMQVQVRDEQGGQGGVNPAPSPVRGEGGRFYSSTVTFSMMTSSFGTSPWPPWLPVETFSIASTTSMPSTTLPNTQ